MIPPEPNEIIRGGGRYCFVWCFPLEVPQWGLSTTSFNITLNYITKYIPQEASLYLYADELLIYYTHKSLTIAQ